MENGKALLLTTPFKNIAIALSGGGFRVASFSLGTLSYLQHLKLDIDETGNPSTESLLDHVSFISSASGGTITTSIYSMLRNKNESFGSIYKFIFSILDGQKILNAALSKLNDDKEWDETHNAKRRNLINAFAKAYDDEMFKGKTFGIYWDQKGFKELEVCFNVTEFHRGLPFRFQTDGESATRELIGNEYVHFNPKYLEEIKSLKLGDILAASSCFPSGFEPIVFPEDFSYTDKNGTIPIDRLRQAMLIEHYDKTISSFVVGKQQCIVFGK